MGAWNSDDLVTFVRNAFRKLADPEKAPQMQAYMKTDMPFYGIQKPQRVPVYREMTKRFVPRSMNQYRQAVLTLWNDPHREDKYAAIHFAQAFPDFVHAGSIPLYRRLIVHGAWWDFVDAIAIDLVGVAHRKNPGRIWPVVDSWIDGHDMWLRRTAIICQVKHKDATDENRLFDFCRRRMHEKEFFIRKAIGWALRAHSYTNPESVRDFLTANRDQLSGLSFREGAKQLARIGLAPV